MINSMVGKSWTKWRRNGDRWIYSKNRLERIWFIWAKQRSREKI